MTAIHGQPPNLVQLPSSTNSAPDVPEHIHRRFFIGPMPEKVISQHKPQGKATPFLAASSTDSEPDDEVSQIIKEHAVRFWVQRGGKPEDWGEEEEDHLVTDMAKRWRRSEWGEILSRKKIPAQQRRWVGGSFEVGTILGVNILEEDALSRISSRPSQKGASSAYLPMVLDDVLAGKAPASASSATGRETFITAPSGPSTAATQGGFLSPPPRPDIVITGEEDNRTKEPSPSTSSATPLLRESHSDPALPPPRPALKLPHSDGAAVPVQSRKGKARAVHYPDFPQADTPSSGSELGGGDDSPVPPEEVLDRSGDSVEDTSAGAMVDNSSFQDSRWDDVIMRDRMLVRVFYSELEMLPAQFDEARHRTTSQLNFEAWAEYMTVWRKDRIELYEDYTIPGKEWITKHKHLAFVIPLRSTRTRMSLYSFVDLTFSILCHPTSTNSGKMKSRKFLHIAKEGTNIFVFKVKNRSRAFDWIWRLWLQLDGHLPSILEISTPSLETKVRVDLPNVPIDEIYNTFTRQYILSKCVTALRAVPSYQSIIERQIADGKALQLAWRMNTNLDWIWMDEDLYGDPRYWVVLCGLALQKTAKSGVHLELRVGQHFPSYLTTRDGLRLEEPAAIEGYLDRIKPGGQGKTQVYLVTHNGNLFTLTPSKAYPPTPLGAKMPMAEEDSNSRLNYSERLRHSEVKRGASQIMGASGVCDLRSILLVRRAMQLVSTPEHTEGVRQDQDDGSWVNVWSQPDERLNSDDEDEGGEEVLAKHADKPRQRMRRSFELLLKNGRVIRFEAYSRRLCLEWIEKLRALIVYWKQRHRVDANDEMDLAQSYRPRLTPLIHVHPDTKDVAPEAPADPSAPLPALGTLFNWCVLDGCKPIVRGGKVYMRSGMHGQYKLVQMFIIPGYVIQFHVKPQSVLYPPCRKKLSLTDAYVVSGYFAAQTLPSGQYDPSAPRSPRRYQDGLETDDPEEDLLFMIWYRQTVTNTPTQSLDAPPSSTVPPLSAKKKTFVFRTRSKLERDAWVWALNCEIEKLARLQKDREILLRETGRLVRK